MRPRVFSQHVRPTSALQMFSGKIDSAAERLQAQTTHPRNVPIKKKIMKRYRSARRHSSRNVPGTVASPSHVSNLPGIKKKITKRHRSSARRHDLHLVTELGKGTNGVAWKAYDEWNQRNVVVKFFNRFDQHGTNFITQGDAEKDPKMREILQHECEMAQDIQ